MCPVRSDSRVLFLKNNNKERILDFKVAKMHWGFYPTTMLLAFDCNKGHSSSSCNGNYTDQHRTQSLISIFIPGPPVNMHKLVSDSVIRLWESHMYSFDPSPTRT